MVSLSPLLIMGIGEMFKNNECGYIMLKPNIY